MQKLNIPFLLYHMKYLLKISIKRPKIEISFDAGKTSKKGLGLSEGVFFATRRMQKGLYSETRIILGGLLLKIGKIWGYLQKMKK